MLHSYPGTNGIGPVYFPPRGGGAPADPLAGIPNLLYWRGTKNIGTSGMYLDTACTVPITAEWDAVAGLKDESSDTIIATQADEARRPLARVAADGSWYWEGDGADDWLDPALSLDGQVVYSVVMRSVTATANSFWGPIDSVAGVGNNVLWGVFNSGTTEWFTGNPPVGVSRNGVSLISPFDSAPLDAWAAYTVTSRVSFDGPAARGIGRFDGFYGSWDCHALFLHPQPADPGNEATVDAYFNTIIPVE